MKEYVELRDGAYKLTNSRVSLDSIVYAYWNGDTPEGIVDAFDTLEAEQVYGAIAYYLAHRPRIDAYLEEQKKEYERKREASRAADPEFYQKLSELKRHRQTTVP